MEYIIFYFELFQEILMQIKKRHGKINKEEKEKVHNNKLLVPWVNLAEH